MPHPAQVNVVSAFRQHRTFRLDDSAQAVRYDRGRRSAWIRRRCTGEGNIVGRPRSAFNDTGVSIGSPAFGFEASFGRSRGRPEVHLIRPRVSRYRTQ